MDLFKLSIDMTAEVYSIDENTYIETTKREKPFFIPESKDYFAICPSCNNPIRIVNLFENGKVTDDDTKTPVRTHGRHVKKDVKGVSKYDQLAYDNCDLTNSNTAKLGERYTDKSKPNEIVGILKTYHPLLQKHIQMVIGASVSSYSFKRMMSTFIGAEGYYYRRVTPWNLPYSFLYMQKQVILHGRFINKYDRGDKLSEIIDMSKNFTIKNNKIVKDNDDSNSKLYLYFTNHRVIQKIRCEKMDIIIEEKVNGKVNVLHKEVLEVDRLKFYNEIREQVIISNMLPSLE